MRAADHEPQFQSSVNRDEQINDWLVNSLGIARPAPRPASSDASFRRYLRVDTDEGTRIVMDAPPEHEDCGPFVGVTAILRDWGLHAPEILAADPERGFLLLEDLGSTTYLDAVSSDSDDAEPLYEAAVDALVEMQRRAADDPRVRGLPPYDEALLRNEMALFRNWLLEVHLGRVLDDDDEQDWSQVTDCLVESALSQPRGFVHRDYHSRNLMVCDGLRPGIIDHQDAMYGPLTYDLVSLLRDCYRRWSADMQATLIRRFVDGLSPLGLLGELVDDDQFASAFDHMGVQRHLKAAGIFARLNHRDGKPGYLEDVPRTVGYIAEVAERDTALLPLKRLLHRHLPGEWLDPASRKDTDAA